MKILNIENGKKVLYIQVSDIKLLSNMGYSIPLSIHISVNDNDNNYSNFIAIYDEEDIKTFDNINLVINYRDYSNKSDSYFRNEIDKLKKKMKMLEYNNQLYYYHIFKYKLETIQNIYNFKIGKKSTNLPMVIDVDGKNYNSVNYNCFESLIPNKVIVYKRNGYKFNSVNDIYGEEYDKIINYYSQYKENTSVSKVSISEDKKYIIINFKYLSMKNNNRFKIKKRKK